MTEIKVLASVPTDAKVVAMGVSTTGPMPRGLGMTRKDLSAHGFDAKSGQTFFVPRAGGHGTLLVGLGESKSVTANSLRNAGAAIARATTPDVHHLVVSRKSPGKKSARYLGE